MATFEPLTATMKELTPKGINKEEACYVSSLVPITGEVSAVWRRDKEVELGLQEANCGG